MIDKSVKQLLKAFDQRLKNIEKATKVCLNTQLLIIEAMQKEVCPHCKEGYTTNEETIAIQDDGACLACQRNLLHNDTN